MPLSTPAALLLALSLLAACSSQTVTQPARSATEQLLISTAIDRAAERLAAALPVRGKLFLEPVNLDGNDGKYAVGAVREALLRHGDRVVASRLDADTIVELRSGALSIDSDSLLVGVPSISLPLVQGLATPKIALFSEDLNQGVVKLVGTAYDPKSGELVAASGPAFGFANQAEWTALLVMSWTTSDIKADQQRPEPLPWD
ncbi:hypothetical protein SAMN06265365_10568 [Tistlia consotensis]|uniref:Group 4 capsule polysaccharide lipoprotein gfcB, YjbF n=1 Tax=Tistlia consotensis USBA 355 TaxID=560819 RepID=A0A1Y6BJ91_9PROT|nr:DUF6655 family protein [Tistlia consotensis]SMF14093.1 hypothetical protein SAMN05428998_105230 [Tistlia consotensis USBA 355]SNR49883.1 hypothetical protein SAMN06265365_10568 [Tistlia consotensis]